MSAYFCGLCRKSTISFNASFASSWPATSCEGLAGLSLCVDLGIGLSEGHGISHAAHPLGHALTKELANDHKHQDRQKPAENKILQR